MNQSVRLMDRLSSFTSLSCYRGWERLIIKEQSQTLRAYMTLTKESIIINPMDKMDLSTLIFKEETKLKTLNQFKDHALNWHILKCCRHCRPLLTTTLSNSRSIWTFRILSRTQWLLRITKMIHWCRILRISKIWTNLTKYLHFQIWKRKRKAKKVNPLAETT